MKRNEQWWLEGRRDFLRRGAEGAAVVFGAAGWAQAADRGRNPFAYDVEKYRRTDAALVGYARVNRFPAPHREPRRLASGAEGRLYLAAGDVIVVMDSSGGPVNEIACGGAVRSLAVAADGVIYAGMRTHVEIYDSKGRRQGVWDAPKGRPFLTGLAADARHVYAGDAGNRLVWRYDRAGKVLGRIGEKDKERNVPGLVLPSPFLDVEIAGDGLLRVNNPGRHRVEVYTPEGDLELAWGKASMAMEGFCGCCNPINLALLPDGRCVTFEKGLPRVKVYGVEGGFDCVVAGVESFAETAKEEAIRDADERRYGGLDGVVDAAGRVYVLDLLAAEIQVFERKEKPA